ncbi:MAG: energy transducer TonB [Myxococcaceae bacterium]
MPLAAVAVHGLVLGLVVLSSILFPSKPRPPPEKKPVTASLRRIDSRQWQANRGAARNAQPLERPVDPKPQGQVVDVAPGNDRVPTESKYLATTNNAVLKQTRARDQVQKWSVATAKTTEHPEEKPAAKGEAAKSTPPPSGVNLAESMLGKRMMPSLLPDPVSGTGDPDTSTAPVGTQGGTERQGGDMTEGGGAPNDALNDVAEGDSTSLNTREWKYAGFFNRVKQAVSAKWDPNGRLRQRNRSLNAVERVTVMAVTLKPDGAMTDIYVVQSSGIDELDAEAMTAFERAAPFPNPPAGLVENGFIRFTFGFHVSNGNMLPPSPFRFR